MQIVTLSLFRYASIGDRAWAFSRMQMAKRPLSRLPGLAFFKLMGTGGGEGFDLRPNFSVTTLLSVWENEESAAQGVAQSAIYRDYRRHVSETATLFLKPLSSRGRWAGCQPFHISDATGKDEAQLCRPLVALTRASVRARHLPRFWKRVPAISKRIAANPAVRFHFGMGEIPWLHQVTVSMWENGEAMQQFSIDSPEHGQAVQAAYRENWFCEQLFARFAVMAVEGQWDGRDAAEKWLRPQPGDATATSWPIAAHVGQEVSA